MLRQNKATVVSSSLSRLSSFTTQFLPANPPPPLSFTSLTKRSSYASFNSASITNSSQAMSESKKQQINSNNQSDIQRKSTPTTELTSSSDHNNNYHHQRHGSKSVPNIVEVDSEGMTLRTSLSRNGMVNTPRISEFDRQSIIEESSLEKNRDNSNASLSMINGRVASVTLAPPSFQLNSSLSSSLVEKTFRLSNRRLLNHMQYGEIFIRCTQASSIID